MVIDSGTIDTMMLLALAQLPALTTLRAVFMEPDSWAGLSGLAQLRTLQFVSGREFSAEHLMALQTSLNSLPHLSHLYLTLDCDFRMSVENPRPPLFLQLPALRRLDLCEVRVPSFAFLQHSPLLEELTLKGSEVRSGFAQPFAEAFEVLRLHTPLLRSLSFVGVMRLSEDQQALLRPPSAMLPQLHTFRWSRWH